MATVKTEAPDGPSTDDLDLMPLIQRKRTIPSNKPPPAPSSTEHQARPVDMAVKRFSPDVLREWPGLPRGVKFDPSDEELLWHLLAKVGKGEVGPHPLINEFITSLDEDDEFYRAHPQKLPGVKQDGGASYFFHKALKAFSTGNQHYWKIHNDDFGATHWHKVGKTKPVILDGVHQGSKKIMVLHMAMRKGEKPEKTNWVMHQYHLGRGDEGEGEFVASKIFYSHKSRHCDNKAQYFQLETIDGFVSEAEAGTHSMSSAPEIHSKSQNLKLSAQSAGYQEMQRKETHSRVAWKKHGNCNNRRKKERSAGYQEMQGKETHSRVAWKKHGNCNNRRKKVRVRGEIKDHPLDPQQSAEIVAACDKPSQIHSSCLDEADTNGPSLSDNALIGMRPVKNELREFHTVHDEFHGELPSKTCTPPHAPENINLKSMSSSMFDSSDSLISQNPCTVDQSLPITLNDRDAVVLEPICENNVVVFSPSLVKLEALDSEGFATALSQTDGAEYNAGMVGSPKPLGNDYDNIVMENTAEKFQFNCNQQSDSVIPTFPVEVKTEPLDGSYDNISEDIPKEEANLSCDDHPSFLKDLNFDPTYKHYSTLENRCKSPSSFLDFNPLSANVKGEVPDELTADVLDHILLKDRIEMPLEGSLPNSGCGKKQKRSRKMSQLASSSGSIDSLNAKANNYLIRKKRKKTATDSVETALEEDVPGLLKVLLDKGITIEEIKLYGEIEDDEALEISTSKDGFEELENIITKLYFERSSLFKFSSGQQINGLKADYCLTCLVSLIEQARYSQFRSSPVEWGWCRDLQSFIFVFESHNRIVLERPEYGYATYFFELVDSLPVDWQIKRLVTTMKLSSCSRTTLIENRSLVIGEDLSEGEALVLEEYGWVPNSGLGTMLNYCDRVVHDRKRERCISDWRAKIGKLLMNGLDGGRSVVTNFPKKVVEYLGNDYPTIKLEL